MIKIEDLELSIKKLELKTGDVVHMELGRVLDKRDLVELHEQVRRWMPDGVTTMITFPGTVVRVESAAKPANPPIEARDELRQPLQKPS